MNIAAYCRVSTDKADQLNSLEAQKTFFTAYAARTGQTLTRLYADEGISGTKVRRRKAFLQMMEDAERGLFSILVVKDISRLARNTVDLLQSVRRLKALGVQTLFLTANMDSMGDSEFILTLFGALAQEESANMSKRIKFGKRVNAQRGRVPNLVYGYDKTPGDYFHLTVNQREAAVVRQIYSLYIQDGCGAGKIAALLNGQGLRTKQGRAWSQNAVSRILQNPIYTGKIVNGKEEIRDFLTSERTARPREDWLITDRPELQIVSPEDFQTAGQIRSARNLAFHGEHRRENSRHLLSTLIRCKDCGRSFRRVQRTYRRTYTRWVCGRRNGQGADQCGNTVSLDEDALLNALDRCFLALLPDRQQTAKIFRQELKRAILEQAGDTERGTLEDKLSRLNRQRQKFLTLYADELITRQELDAQLSASRQETQDLEARLQALPPALLPPDALERLADQLTQNPERFLTVRNLSNGQLRQLISHMEAAPDGTVTVYPQTNP